MEMRRKWEPFTRQCDWMPLSFLLSHSFFLSWYIVNVSSLRTNRSMQLSPPPLVCPVVSHRTHRTHCLFFSASFFFNWRQCSNSFAYQYKLAGQAQKWHMDEDIKPTSIAIGDSRNNGSTNVTLKLSCDRFGRSTRRTRSKRQDSRPTLFNKPHSPSSAVSLSTRHWWTCTVKKESNDEHYKCN